MKALNKRAQAIISDIRLKRGSGDVYAPIIRWDEFEAITGALEAAEHTAAVDHEAACSLVEENEEVKRKLEAAEKRIAEQSEIVAAAEKLVRCKGRYHSELNYRALAKLFGVTTPDLPPLKHENAHYADAAEMEIAALRQRIAELEARAVSVPEVRITVAESRRKNLTWRELGVYNEGADVAKEAIIEAIRAAGIGVKGE